MEQKSAYQRFDEIINQVDNCIQFNPDWNNGTGYFDGAFKGEYVPVVEPGQLVKSIDPDGRRIIIVGTRLGNIVVFDRYANWEQNTVFVYQATKEVRALKYFDGFRLGESDLLLLLGSWGNTEENFGNHIEEVAVLLGV